MITFYQTTLLEALGWSLVGSLWKMGSIWIGYTLLTGNGKWFSAAARYFLAVLLLIAGTVWSFAAIFGYYNDIVAGKEISTLAIYFKNIAWIPSFAEWLMPCISGAYIILAVFFLGKLFYQYLTGKATLTKDQIEANESINQMLLYLIKKTGVRKNIRIWLSERISTPLTIGFLKPVILLPIASLNQLSIEQTEAVIAHELFHIRRNDYLVNFLVSFSEIILFFNPFSRLFQHIIRKERENVCDDKVVSHGFDRWQYAHALYTLGKYHYEPAAFALAATGSCPLLLERVRRIIKAAPVKESGNRISGSILKPLAIFFSCLCVPVFFLKHPKPIAQKPRETIGLSTQVSDSVLLAYQPTTIVVLKKLQRAVWIKPMRRLKKISSPQIVVIRKIGRPRVSSPVELIPPPPPPPKLNDMINSFVSITSETPVFTLTVPGISAAQVVKLYMDDKTPFIPSATFYYSDTEDSLEIPSGGIIHL